MVTRFRRGSLSHHALCEALGLDRYETERVLKRHNVTEDLGTAEEYLADARTLDEVLKTNRP